MSKPRLRAIDADGNAVDDPTEDQVHDLLAAMTLDAPFVILERLDREPVDEHYMQVHLHDDMSYLVEYREGSADKHFEAEPASKPYEMFGPRQIAKVMMGWAHDQQIWRDAMPWVPKSW